MSKRNILFIIIGISVCLIIIIWLGWTSSERLVILLRCEDESAGVLYTSFLLEENNVENKKQFKVEEICRTGQLVLYGYKQFQDIRLTFVSSENNEFTLDAMYAHNDIVHDHKDFYIILNINRTFPFLVIDYL